MCPEVLVTLLWEQHGHAAPFERCSPALCASLTSSSRPRARPPCPILVLPQPFPPGGRLASRLHTARENKPDCQAASSRQHPGPGLGFFSRELLWPPRSVPARLAAAPVEEEQGALPSVCGCVCRGAPGAPRAPSGRPKVAGRRESWGKPQAHLRERPPPGSSPARQRRPLPRWRGRAVRARLRRRARLVGRRREWRGVGGDPLRERNGSERVRRAAAGGLGAEGCTALPVFPCRDGRGRAGTGLWRDRTERAGTGDVAVRCRRRCRPRLWLPAPRRPGSLLSSAPLNTRLSKGRGRRALPGVRRDYGGSPCTTGG